MREAMIAITAGQGAVFVTAEPSRSEPLAKASLRKTEHRRYVERKTPKFARAILRDLNAMRDSLALKVARAYRSSMRKADEGTEAIVQAIIDDLGLDASNADLVATIRAQVEDTFSDGAAFGFTQVGFAVSTEQVDPLAVEYAKTRGAELIKDFEQTTEAGLRSVLADAVENGLSVDELASNIQDAGIFSEQRAVMIARTELAMAHTEGNMEGWRQTGEVEGKESILGDMHPEEDICDECAAAGVVGLDEDFVPGFSAPPYHPNCECAVLPVLRGDANNES